MTFIIKEELVERSNIQIIVILDAGGICVNVITIPAAAWLSLCYVTSHTETLCHSPQHSQPQSSSTIILQSSNSQYFLSENI